MSESSDIIKTEMHNITTLRILVSFVTKNPISYFSLNLSSFLGRFSQISRTNSKYRQELANIDRNQQISTRTSKYPPELANIHKN